MIIYPALGGGFVKAGGVLWDTSQHIPDQSSSDVR